MVTRRVSPKFHIAIPSKGRALTATTPYFFDKKDVIIYVEPQDYQAYTKQFEGYTIKNIGANDKGISFVRNFILDDNTDKFLVIDDDIKSLWFKNKDGKIEKLNKKDTYLIVRKLYELLDIYSVVCLPHKQFENLNNKELSEFRRCITFVGINKNNIGVARYDEDINIHEDQDFCIQVVKNGFKIATYHNFCFINDYKSSGGCSDIRKITTHELEAEKIIEKYGDGYFASYTSKNSNFRFIPKYKRFYIDGKNKKDFYIAIPSRGRADKITTIEALGLSKELFTIFVDTEEEAREYRKHNKDVKVVVTGKHSITPVRNFILDYYNKGDKIIMMCDDVKEIVKLREGGGPLRRLSSNEVLNLIQVGFDSCERFNTKLWGVYPIPNHFFMSNTISPNNFIIGTFSGVIVSDIRMDEGCVLKEDYDFTIKHILKYKKVVRFNYVAVKAKHYSNTGGCVDYRSNITEQQSINRLLELYPGLVKLNPKRKNEILLNFRVKK